jgi:hypothetical protein
MNAAALRVGLCKECMYAPNGQWPKERFRPRNSAVDPRSDDQTSAQIALDGRDQALTIIATQALVSTFDSTVPPSRDAIAIAAAYLLRPSPSRSRLLTLPPLMASAYVLTFEHLAGTSQALGGFEIWANSREPPEGDLRLISFPLERVGETSRIPLGGFPFRKPLVACSDVFGVGRLPVNASRQLRQGGRACPANDR